MIKQRLFRIAPVGARVTDAWITLVPSSQKIVVCFSKAGFVSVRIVPAWSALRERRWLARWFRLDVALRRRETGALDL